MTEQSVAPSPHDRTGTEYDVVVVGAGSGGIAVATGARDRGMRVAIVSAGFVGGECAFVACIPSKSLLRSARARREAHEADRHGAAPDPLPTGPDDRAWTAAVRRRDSAANNRDDSNEAQQVNDDGIDVIRGFGRITGPGQVEIDGRRLTADRIVLDTGSTPVIPDIDGLDDVPTWTSDQALSSDERPDRLLIVGGGPIGCELAQAYSAFGTEVTVIDTSDRPVSAEDPALGAAMLQVLRHNGVHLMLEARPEKAFREGDDVVLQLEDGRRVTGDRVLLVTGRKPATDALDATKAGVELDESGAVVVDDRCRAADGVWAVGDVTGVAPYTHTATHQAAVVVDDIGGGELALRVHADALPRAVYTDPPLAATGLTEQQARDTGADIVVAEVDLADVSRAGTEGDGPLGPENSSGGILRLVADRTRRVLVGAGAVGPDADSWITEATLAIRAQIPIDLLAEVVRPFPTFAEAFTAGYRELRGQLS
ncbi:dihydrolipoyl dehydrogenase family protein [Jatrophihabitans sp. YIM 134969]